MANIRIEPLRHDELDELIRLYWAAFEPLEADMIVPMIYTKGLNDELLDRLRQRVLREAGGNLGELCFTAKDNKTNEIIAVSRWGIEKNPPHSQVDIDAAFEKANQARNGSPIEGTNVALGQAAVRATIYSEYETMQSRTNGKPYMVLRLLATHPKHHRRGAGSMLLKQGLAKADRLGLPVFLHAGVHGRPLYERFEFEVTGDLPFDGTQYGGRSRGTHWCMVRPAQS